MADEYDYWYPEDTNAGVDDAWIDFAGSGSSVSPIEFTDNPQVYIPHSGGLSGPMDAPDGIDESNGQPFWMHPDGSVMYTPHVDDKGVEQTPYGTPTGRTAEDIVGKSNLAVPVGTSSAGGSSSGLAALLKSLLGGGGGGSSKSWMPFLLAALAASKLNKSGGSSGANNAVIPRLTASRSQTPYSQQRPAGYRPGQGGITYFTPTTYAAAGGPMGIAGLGSYAAGGKGRLVNGTGDGVSDDVPATIDGQQPARIARGEYVIPARVVAELGNGSTEAGAERLDDMVTKIEDAGRKAKRGTDSGAHKYLKA